MRVKLAMKASKKTGRIIFLKKHAVTVANVNKLAAMLEGKE